MSPGQTEPDRSTATDAILFDFFGTLVEYEPERSRLDYPETLGLLRSWGLEVASHGAFLADWNAASDTLESEACRSLREFTMADVARAFSERAGHDLSARRCQLLGDAFVAEWQRHVVPVPGVADLLRRLGATRRLGVVSNTHDHSMVPDMLRRLGVADLVDPVVLSVEHGWRKPHPSIYERARTALSMPATRVAFVGDDPEADFAGPDAAGMIAYLIDPTSKHPVPDDRRLATVSAIETSLAAKA